MSGLSFIEKLVEETRRINHTDEIMAATMIASQILEKRLGLAHGRITYLAGSANSIVRINWKVESSDYCEIFDFLVIPKGKPKTTAPIGNPCPGCNLHNKQLALAHSFLKEDFTVKHVVIDNGHFMEVCLYRDEFYEAVLRLRLNASAFP